MYAKNLKIFINKIIFTKLSRHFVFATLKTAHSFPNLEWLLFLRWVLYTFTQRIRTTLYYHKPVILSVIEVVKYSNSNTCRPYPLYLYLKSSRVRGGKISTIILSLPLRIHRNTKKIVGFGNLIFPIQIFFCSFYYQACPICLKISESREDN